MLTSLACSGATFCFTWKASFLVVVHCSGSSCRRPRPCLSLPSHCPVCTPQWLTAPCPTWRQSLAFCMTRASPVHLCSWLQPLVYMGARCYMSAHRCTVVMRVPGGLLCATGMHIYVGSPVRVLCARVSGYTLLVWILGTVSAYVFVGTHRDVCQDLCLHICLQGHSGMYSSWLWCPISPRTFPCRGVHLTKAQIIDYKAFGVPLSVPFTQCPGLTCSFKCTSSGMSSP